MVDRDQYDEFVIWSSPRLARMAYLLTRDWESAQDLLQTALAKSWFAWRRIQGDPEPYVRKVMVNSYISWMRQPWRHEVPTSAMPDVPAREVSVVERLSLWDALGRLPRRQRAVVVLRYFEDLTEPEIARMIGCRVGTVKSQLSRALAKMRVDVDLRHAFNMPALPVEARPNGGQI